MSVKKPVKQVLARYSALKVPGLVLLVVSVCYWILADGWARGWRPPPGPRAIAGLLAYGAAPFGIFGGLAVLSNLIIARGVAIARIGDQLVLYFPFGWRRVPLNGSASVTATTFQSEVPEAYSSAWFKTPTIVGPQVTISRFGQPDLNMRTGLLSENAEVIVGRISSVLA